MRVRREAAVLEVLASAAPRLPVPRVIGATDDPVVFVTEWVAGAPLGFDDVRRFRPDEREAVAAQLASFLAELHDPRLLDAVAERVPELVAPRPQAETARIRLGLPRFLDERRVRLVDGWCDVVDEILGRPSPAPVLVHGDLHGYNQVWERGAWALRLVADFEVAGPADPEYDVRYVPSQDDTLALVHALRRHYSSLSGRDVDMTRVAAWYVRTALGDALWRSEAGVPLPGGGTPLTYVDDLERKLPELLAS